MNTKEINRKIRYRWICFFSLAIVGVLVQFHRSSTAVIYDQLTESFGLTATSYSLLSSMYFYPYVIMQLPNGVLADRFGARRTVVIGGVLTVAGTLIFSMAQSYAMMCIGRVLVGMGVSTQMVCMQKLNAAWFRSTEMATISGINSTIGSLGGLVSQAPLALLVTYISWRAAFGWLAAFSAVIYIVCFLLVRDHPHQKGLQTIDEMEGRETVRRAAPKVGTAKAIVNLLRNKNMWPMFIIMPICMGAYTVFSGTWGVPYLRNVYGLSNVEASTMTSYMMVGMFIGSMSAGFISDKLRSRKKVIIGICSIVCFEWMMLVYGSSILASSRLLLSVIIFIFGFTASAVPVSLSTVREFNDRQYVGTAVGLGNMIGMLASAFFPTICGSLQDKFAHLSGIALYRHTFGYIAILSCVALLVAIVFLKDTHCEYMEPELCGKK